MRKTCEKPFYLQWICVAFTNPLRISGLIAAVIGAIAYLAYKFWGTPHMDINLWMLAAALGGLVLARLILAPYWINKEKDRTIKMLSKTLESKTTGELFTIESYGYDFGTSEASGYPKSDTKRIIRIDMLITAIPSEWVESVELTLLDYRIGTDWKQDWVSSEAPTGGYFYFYIPDSIKQGTYTAQLTTFADGIPAKSKPFQIEVPK